MKVGINGFGRVGRQVYKALAQYYPQYEVAQINDIAEAKALAHLFKYDSTYGVYPEEVSCSENTISIGQKKVEITHCTDLNTIEWQSGIELVIEATGRFTDREKASLHLKKDVANVVITAPSKNADFMVVLGVNDHVLDPVRQLVISNASCTTNSLAPAVKLLHQHFNLLKGFMTTVHAYTSDQRILDLPHSDMRRARAAAVNIIPTSTGAADAVGIVMPELKGLLTGISLRVPVAAVSVTDFVCSVEKPTTSEQVNAIFEEASQTNMKGIMGFTMEPLVSSDFIRCSNSGTIDGISTNVLAKNFIKILSWYDNEWGYSCRIADLTHLIFQKKNSEKSL
jgi:glyceraldehyde 3-phosphate dehydrogenase